MDTASAIDTNLSLLVDAVVAAAAVARDGVADGEGDATAKTSFFPQLLEHSRLGAPELLWHPPLLVAT